MEIKQSLYVGSYVSLEKCPKQEWKEFAFIGRSNVGKSSLINLITGRRKLAKVSVTPGKTQTLNFFAINQAWHLVDLPGYGYAKVSRSTRDKWDAMIRNYLLKRKQLQYVFVLVDSRVPPQKIDIEFISFCGENKIPVAIVFTKADRPKAKDTTTNISEFQKQLAVLWDEFPPMFITSARAKTGAEPILSFIETSLYCLSVTCWSER